MQVFHFFYNFGITNYFIRCTENNDRQVPCTLFVEINFSPGAKHRKVNIKCTDKYLNETSKVELMPCAFLITGPPLVNMKDKGLLLAMK